MARSRSTSRHRVFGRTRLLAGAGLIALLGGLAAIGLSSEGRREAQPDAVPTTTTSSGTTPVTTPPRPKSVRVAVEGVGAYDPEGDRSENDDAAALATDGLRSTAWKSERYRRSFVKTGVGLVVEAQRPVRANRVVVATETPGYTADVRIGSSPGGPFVVVSKAMSMKGRTIITLRPRSGRYLMLWITSMPEEGVAAVNEITVTAAG